MEKGSSPLHVHIWIISVDPKYYIIRIRWDRADGSLAEVSVDRHPVEHWAKSMWGSLPLRAGLKTTATLGLDPGA